MHVALLALLALLAGGQTRQPYYEFSTAGAGAHGAGRETPDPVGLDTVRIGVLAPAKTAAGLELRRGVALAVAEANRRGGYRDIPYEALFRAEDGPWGMAAKQVVDFSYDDKVWAIVGGLDGATTHIAELVVAKTWVPVISPTASDSSVDYANVPWVFRSAPSDRRQAAALLRYAGQNGCATLVVLNEAEREARTGAGQFRQQAWQERRPVAAQFEFERHNPEAGVRRVAEVGDTDSVVVWAQPEPALAAIRELRRAGFRGLVLGPAALAAPEILAADGLGQVVVAAPCDLSAANREWQAFAGDYRRQFGADASAVSLFAYDSARAVIEAIARAGLNRMRIRDELARMSLAGATGRLEFDSLRGRKAEPVLLRPGDGHWEPAADGCAR